MTQNYTISDFKNITHFRGLNALRFFAAFLVVIHHSETIRRKNEIPNLEWLDLFKNGGNAVTFFFVLSGFLISYLLLKELNASKTISIKKFYVKRILRIWPLYFLLIFIGAICLPYIFTILNVNYEMPYTFSETWYYFIFFLPGFVTFYFGHHFLEPLWSIGVEEVFYLIWAPLFKICKKVILQLLFAIILIKLILVLINPIIKNELYAYIMAIFKFDAMCIGGLGAFVVFHFGNRLKTQILFKPVVQFVLISLLFLFLTFNSNIDILLWNIFFKTPILLDFTVNFLFLYLIICVAVLDNGILKLEYKILNYLGEISYGIYMYHMLAIFTTIFLIKSKLQSLNIIYGSAFFYFCVLSLTLIMAIVSKHFFEDFFLRIKKRLEPKPVGSI